MRAEPLTAAGLAATVSTRYLMAADGDRSLIRKQFGITYSSDPVNVYIPQAIPGQRAPHVWLDRDGERISSLDLFGRSPWVLCGPRRQPGAEHLGVGCWRFIEHSSSGFLPAR